MVGAPEMSQAAWSRAKSKATPRLLLPGVASPQRPKRSAMQPPRRLRHAKWWLPQAARVQLTLVAMFFSRRTPWSTNEDVRDSTSRRQRRSSFTMPEGERGEGRFNAFEQHPGQGLHHKGMR